jgi:hypothetical protein
MRAASATRSFRRRDQTASYQILQRILAIDGRQPADRPAPPCDNHLGALLDPLQMLAQAIVKLPDPHLVLPHM